MTEFSKNGKNQLEGQGKGMRIGIYFSSFPDHGGGYQQKINVLEILKEKNTQDSFVLLTYNKDIQDSYQRFFRVVNVHLYETALGLIKAFKKNSGLYNFFEVLVLSAYSRRLKRECDLIFFLGPSDICYKLKIPYIFTVNDLMHKYYPHFPEVSSNGELDRRESMYRNGFANSLAIVCESETGKDDVISFYGSIPEKIFVFPFLPPHYLKKQFSLPEIERVKNRYKLPEKYIFYPANFWHHKNHQLIVKGLSLLKKEQGIRIDAVFIGSIMEEKAPQNCYQVTMDLARHLNVLDQVHYLGRISNDEISVLYRKACALVMPTFFGPSNIPYLEAFYLDCPVITSDLRGIKDQVDGAAILINPNYPEDLATAILQLKNPDLVRNLIDNGHIILNKWTKSDYSKRMDCLFEYCRSKCTVTLDDYAL